MNNTTIDIDNFVDGVEFEYKYIQSRFNNLFNKYFEKCIEILGKNNSRFRS